MTVTNPKVTEVLVQIQHTFDIVGLTNYANLYIDASSDLGSPLLLQGKSMKGESGARFPVSVGTQFSARLQLYVDATYKIPGDAWQVQRIEIIPLCSGVICSLQ